MTTSASLIRRSLPSLDRCEWRLRAWMRSDNPHRGSVHDLRPVRPDDAEGLYSTFRGHTDVKEARALHPGHDHQGETGPSTSEFAVTSTTASSSAQQAEPRLGIAYNIKPSNTVLRVSYARTMETPFNENLVLSKHGDAEHSLSPTSSRCSAAAPTPSIPASAMNFTPACSRHSG